MSHFATLVIHKEGADIDGILAPFCETDEDFFEFYDFTDEIKKEYSAVTVKRVKMPDGKYYNYGDKIFAKKVSKEEYYKNQNGFRSYISSGRNGLNTEYILCDYIEKGGALVIADIVSISKMKIFLMKTLCSDTISIQTQSGIGFKSAVAGTTS